MAIKWKVPRWMLLFLYKMAGVNPLHKMFYVMVLWGIVLPFCIQFVCFRLCKLFFGVKPWQFIEKMCVEEICWCFFPHLIVFAVRSISNHVYVWSCLFKCSLCKRTCFDTSCIHHKTGPLLCHYRCSLLASCCSKFFLWSVLLLKCLWLLFAWAYVNAQFVSNEACNQTSHMGCLNACLLWQKPGTIKWEGPTPYMNHKKAQEGLMRLDLRYEESIKWSSWPPWIHHKTGPLLWPLQVFPAGTLLLQVFPLVCFASEVPLASFCMGLCKFPVAFKWST